MLEVLHLGDEGGQHAVAQVASHQLSVHTSHQAQLMIFTLCNVSGFQGMQHICKVTVTDTSVENVTGLHFTGVKFSEA